MQHARVELSNAFRVMRYRRLWKNQEYGSDSTDDRECPVHFHECARLTRRTIPTIAINPPDMRRAFAPAGRKLIRPNKIPQTCNNPVARTKPKAKVNGEAAFGSWVRGAGPCNMANA